MGEWTNLRINQQVEYKTNLTRTTVTIITMDGKYTESVEKLRIKVNDPYILTDVQKMFRAMLEFYENEL